MLLRMYEQFYMSVHYLDSLKMFKQHDNFNVRFLFTNILWL